MEIRNVTHLQLIHALEAINVKFKGNIEFNRCDSIGKLKYRVTLKVKDCHAPGHRSGFPKIVNFNPPAQDMSKRRCLPYACWHVHGEFFEALLNINSDIIIITGSRINGTNICIDKKGGNW